MILFGKRTLIAIVLALTVCTTLSWVSFAQLRVEAGTVNFDAQPGEFVTVVFNVFNDSTEATSATLTLNLPEGFTSLGVANTVALAAQSFETFFLTLVVSEQAVSGANTVFITATSATNAANSASASITIHVLQVPGLQIQTPTTINVEVEQAFELTFIVVNTGNANDQVLLTLDVPTGVEASLPESNLALLPGESRAVPVSATIGQGVPPGTVRITLTAMSTQFAELTVTAIASVSLLPLRPEEVGGVLVLEAPSRLSFIAVVPDEATPAVFTHQFAGNADFNDGERINYRLTVDNFSVRNLLFELERTTFASRLGLITVSWSDLISFSGAGAQLSFNKVPLLGNLSLGALSNDMLPSVGMQKSVSFLEMNLTTSQLLRFNTETQIDFLSSISVEQPLGESLTLSSEWALSDREGIRDIAVLIESALTFDTLVLQSTFVRAGSDFVGARSDEVGFEILQTFTHDTNFAVGSFLSHIQNNVNRNPLLETRTTTQLFSNLRWLPDPRLPTVFLSVNFNGFRTDNDVESSLLITNIRLSQALGERATTSAFVQQDLALDSLNLSELETFSYGIDLAYASETFSGLIGLSQATQIDLVANTIDVQDINAVASVQLSGDLSSLTLTGTRTFDSLTLAALLSAELGPWDANAELSLERLNNGDIDFDAQAGIAVSFDTAIPFIPVNGRVEGSVFDDLNENGQKDFNEPGIADIVIGVGDTQARTNDDGLFRTPPLAPGEYAVNVTQLPLNLTAVTVLPQSASVTAGDVTEFNIVLTRVVLIEGALFHDDNQDGIRQIDEFGIPNARVLLRGPNLDNATRTATDGSFVFTDLLPGVYTLTLDATTLPPRFDPTTPTQLEVVLTPGDVAEVLFGAFERPQTIIFVPTADFSVDPISPRVGQTVVFDGSASFDPDGQVVAFAWDFDGDGTIDSNERVASFVYTTSGEVMVTLTVTDDGGNTDSLTRALEVLPAP